ncbi:MAG TPA: hypothetical protein VF771_06820 [Longimicrobiaceae bacterium]
MATLAHPTAGEFGRSKAGASGARAVLERAVDAAPSHIPPPRGWLRRLLGRDRSARAVIRRYRLWPEIEHAYAWIVREFGPVRVEMSVEDEFGFHFVALDSFVHESDLARLSAFEKRLWRELEERFGRKAVQRMLVTIQVDPRCAGDR